MTPAGHEAVELTGEHPKRGESSAQPCSVFERGAESGHCDRIERVGARPISAAVFGLRPLRITRHIKVVRASSDPVGVQQHVAAKIVPQYAGEEMIGAERRGS